MGYRHRFAAVSKTLVDETANHTIDELRQWCDARGKDTEDGIFFYDIYDQKEIFDFGKDCRFAEELIAKSQPVYHNNDTQEYMDVPVIVKGRIPLCSRPNPSDCEKSLSGMHGNGR